MGLAEFLEGFRQLHEKARKGTLDTALRGEYDRDRDELATALMQAQKTSPTAGERPRSMLRVAKAMQVELSLPAERVRTMTFEVWGKGFSAVLAEAPKPGSVVKCSLRLPNAEMLVAEALTLDAKRQPHNMRVTFQLQGVDPKDQEKLELAVFDEVIAKLSAAPRPRR